MWPNGNGPTQLLKGSSVATIAKTGVRARGANPRWHFHKWSMHRSRSVSPSLPAMFGLFVRFVQEGAGGRSKRVNFGRLVPHLQCDIDIRSTIARLVADMSRPRPVTARCAICSAKSPLRSSSGTMRSKPTRCRSSWRAGTRRPKSSQIRSLRSPDSSSITSLPATTQLAANGSPASRASVALPPPRSPMRTGELRLPQAAQGRHQWGCKPV
jgi:hypothetical protein